MSAPKTHKSSETCRKQPATVGKVTVTLCLSVVAFFPNPIFFSENFTEFVKFLIS